EVPVKFRGNTVCFMIIFFKLLFHKIAPYKEQKRLKIALTREQKQLKNALYKEQSWTFFSLRHPDTHPRPPVF
ncbi:MAG: hypothetical protein KGM98_05405, partial [Bacteroidota bacterium]|nr:hypothetical protein [Bacteroidota bacterium]